MQNFSFYISNREIKSDVKTILANNRKLTAKTTAIYLLLCLVFIAVAVLPAVFINAFLAIPLGLLALILLSLISYGYNAFCLDYTKNDVPNPKLLFSGFSKKIKIILSVLFKRIMLIILWLIVLIVPGILKLFQFSQCHFLIASGETKNILKTSKHIMKSNAGRLFKFNLSFLGLFLLGVLSAGIALPWILPFYNISRATFYENLKSTF